MLASACYCGEQSKIICRGRSVRRWSRGRVESQVCLECSGCGTFDSVEPYFRVSPHSKCWLESKVVGGGGGGGDEGTKGGVSDVCDCCGFSLDSADKTGANLETVSLLYFGRWPVYKPWIKKRGVKQEWQHLPHLRPTFHIHTEFYRMKCQSST